jgi:septal ring factor EnvC (AmiA/AmiB activator)
MYEQTRDLSREAEQLRLTLAASKDSASRLQEEIGSLRVEAARASAALVEREREAMSSSEALQARVARLSSELEQVQCLEHLLPDEVVHRTVTL